MRKKEEVLHITVHFQWRGINKTYRVKPCLWPNSDYILGCLSDPNFSHPGSRIQGQKDSRIPDPDPHKLQRIKNFKPQKLVSKLSEIWSGMFITDPDLESGSWFFTHPESRSRIQGSKKHRIPDPQHCLLVNHTQYRYIFNIVHCYTMPDVNKIPVTGRPLSFYWANNLSTPKQRRFSFLLYLECDKMAPDLLQTSQKVQWNSLQLQIHKVVEL